MTKIKFRVWHKIENRFLPLAEGAGSDYRVLTIDAQDGSVSMTNAYGLDKPVNYRKDEVIVEQFTGLTDKNGVEIFGGDVVAWKWGAMSGKSSVKFYDGCWRLAEYIDAEHNHLETGKYVEVVGNIHENDNMLKR